MNNNLQIDLKNEVQFPLLNSISENLKELIPQDLFYFDSVHLARSEKLYLMDKDFTTSFETIMNELKIRLTDTNYSVLSRRITELKKERDIYLLANLTTIEQRIYVAGIYNSLVIDRIQDFKILLLQMVLRSFRDLISYDAIHKIDIENCFEIWYKEFPIKDDAGNNATPQAAGTNAAAEPMPENLIRFDNNSQKYLLLHELGIIEFLNEKYPLTSNAKKALLLAYITDTKNGKPFENVMSQKDNPKSEHYPDKEKNIIKVNRILAEIGIERKTTIAAIKKK